MGEERLGNQSEKRYNTGYFCGKSRKGGFARAFIFWEQQGPGQ